MKLIISYYYFEPAKSLYKLIPSMIRVTFFLLNSHLKKQKHAGPSLNPRQSHFLSTGALETHHYKIKIFHHLIIFSHLLILRYLTQGVLSHDLWSTKQLHTGSKEGAEQFKSRAQAAQSRFGTQSLLFSTWTYPTLLCYQTWHLALLPCPFKTETFADYHANKTPAASHSLHD